MNDAIPIAKPVMRINLDIRGRPLIWIIINQFTSGVPDRTPYEAQKLPFSRLPH